MADFSPYQQKIIKRYYNNYDSIQSQKLAEMVTEIYLAEGKKLDRLWTRVERDAHQARIPRLEDRPPAREARPGAPGRGDAGAGREVRLIRMSRRCHRIVAISPRLVRI